LLGAAREVVPIYGSGGFTTFSIGRLEEQLSGWASQGMRWVKMKVGTDPSLDLDRVKAARSAIGSAELFVDANGAYDRKQALSFAKDFASVGVVYFEEPVSSDDLEGLRLIRDRAPDGLQIAAGEYGYDLFYFHYAVLGVEAEKKVMGRAGLDYEVMASGCCGMAGSFGLESGKYDVSMKAGERVLLPRVRAADRDCLILADGFSCREQIEQGTGRRTSHLAEIIAAAL
jgi:hypothetical protein